MPATCSAQNRSARRLLLVGGLLAAYFLGANNAPPPSPAVIGVVDILKLIKGLTMNSDADAAREALAQSMADQSTAMIAQAKRLKDDVKLFLPGTPDFNQAEEKSKFAAIDAIAYSDFQKWKIEERKGEDLRTIYESVQKAIAKFAKANGFDVVLLDNVITSIEPGSTSNVLQQIAARRILYADTELDVTNALMKWMNENPQ
jgi:Skp family chaperone for outer membrane proteins